ncbi:LCP family protein [Ruminococcus sp.]|uniref:LCP family protein n=1 Tax=Ruminococcus sp. TaxID=41978 RepID=UPI002E7FC906|nr:LCP family protein [Ruminococcus sp.]MEE3493041.1 LCP family protein [Ruminococcus sp.]
MESLENTENSKDTEGVEDTVSEQKEESSDPAASVSSDEETADKAQSGEAEPVSKTTPHPDDGEETGAEEVALKVSVLSAAEALPEDSAEQNDEAAGNSQESEENPPKKKKWKRILIAAVSIPLAIIIAFVSTFFVMREIGRRNIHTDKKFEVTLPTESSGIMLGDKYGRIINYNGVSYIYNNDIIALTFIGVDDGHGPDKGLKMADAIYVLAIDSKNGKVKLLNISRDIITDVNVYSQEGAFIDTEKIQIAYSNAYSEKGSTGGHNTNRSVSRLMFGLPMENYFEINLDAVSTLNDAVGGVRVTSALTFTSPEDGRTINEGDDVTLHGKEAEYYVRRRDTKELESNNDRMQRQQEYIMSFLGSIVPEVKKNPKVISELYSAIRENSETTLSASELIYIASSAVENIHSLSDIEIIKFDGEIVAGINAEMYVSDDEVLSKMLDIFYEPLNTSATEAPESTETDNSSAAAAQAAASQTTTATAAE